MPERPATKVLRGPSEPASRAAFSDRVSAFLALHEAENNLPLSVVADLGSDRYDTAELLLAVDASGAPQAALVWTPPFNLLLSFGNDPQSREVLLADLLARGQVPPGVTGPEPDAGIVASWLAERTVRVAELQMRQGVYRLERVTPRTPRTPRTSRHRRNGTMRNLQPHDAPTFVPWLAAFNDELGLTLQTAEEQWRRFIDLPGRTLNVLEVDSEAVCLVGIGGATPNGRRIGPVYTPPEHRQRGYAEVLVAMVCDQLLAAGNEFCFLYTDLDYATSNSLYRKVGFELILESAEYSLLPTAN